VMSRGVRASYGVAVNAGFRYIQFNMPGEGEVEAVMTYLSALEPEKSPYLVKDGDDWVLSEKAKKGKAIFESAETGCAGCHPAPLFTDLQLHDVGTRHELDQSGTFDNPTLIEIWQTGPWLHDGSASTMKEVLVDQNKEDKHGKTSHLSEEEIDALAEYLLSL
jgi:cytochrome c peroxidase